MLKTTIFETLSQQGGPSKNFDDQRSLCCLLSMAGMSRPTTVVTLDASIVESPVPESLSETPSTPSQLLRLLGQDWKVWLD